MTALAFVEPSAPPRLPVTIVTRFLGRGKTTLVNHILANQPGLRTAVIVNDLSDIDIDGDLIVSAANGMVELSNGCICCSLNNHFIDVVFRILGRQHELDYMVVETTGVADPLPVALTFLRTELRNLVRLDSIVTVVDAENFALERFDGEAPRNQLAYGDVILLNKCDLVGTERLRALEEVIGNVAAHARITRTTRCDVPLALILALACFNRIGFSPITRPIIPHPPMITRRRMVLSRCPSRATARSGYTNSKSSWRPFRTTFIAPKACFGSPRVTNATFFTWLRNAFLSMRDDLTAFRKTSSY
jgi:hypothetical protein